jgi:hypothetical protein
MAAIRSMTLGDCRTGNEVGDIMTEFDYELFAIRYATRDARRGAHFIGGDPHDGPMPMDYFCLPLAIHPNF